jgi:hypothetical protein
METTRDLLFSVLLAIVLACFLLDYFDVLVK